MHSFEVHSNESACRKGGRLGLEQVLGEECIEPFLQPLLCYFDFSSSAYSVCCFW